MYGNSSFSRFSVVEQDWRTAYDTTSMWVSVPKEKLGAPQANMHLSISVGCYPWNQLTYQIQSLTFELHQYIFSPLFTFYYQKREGK